MQAELCGQLAAQLLAHAAEMLQHLPAVPQPGAAASSASHGAQQPPWQQQQQPDVGELTLAFCEAVCVWAAPVLVAAAGQDEGRTTLATLLQLVLAASAAPGSGIAAARAAKALLQVVRGMAYWAVSMCRGTAPFCSRDTNHVGRIRCNLDALALSSPLTASLPPLPTRLPPCLL